MLGTPVVSQGLGALSTAAPSCIGSGTPTSLLMPSLDFWPRSAALDCIQSELSSDSLLCDGNQGLKHILEFFCLRLKIVFIPFLCVVYVYMHMHMCVYTHPCSCRWRPKVNIVQFPLLLSTLSFETGSLSEPEACRFA